MVNLKKKVLALLIRMGGSIVISCKSPYEGAVEICFNGVWGAVCDNNWGRHEAEVTCRQLGFSTESKEIAYETKFAQLLT